MIECTQFIGDLMKKDKKEKDLSMAADKKYNYLLQSNEMVTEKIEIDEKLLNKKRKKMKIEIYDNEECDGNYNKSYNTNSDVNDIENIFDYDWRS
jgi:hypothetical protein